MEEAKSKRKEASPAIAGNEGSSSEVEKAELVVVGDETDARVTVTAAVEPVPPQILRGMPGIYEFAGISIEELVGNEAALKVVLHTFRQAVDENLALKQQQNFDRGQINKLQQDQLATVEQHNRDTLEKTIGNIMSFTGTIPVGFGIGLLCTPGANAASGWICLLIGVLFAIGGLFLSVHRSLRQWWK